MKRTIGFCITAMMIAVLGFSANGQTLTWPTPTATTLSNVGGDSGRAGIAATVFSNNIYIAYTSTQNCTDHGDCAVVLAHNNGGNSTSFTSQYVYVSQYSEGHVVSNANPALATVKRTDGTQRIFMVVGDSYGSENILWSDDGSNWDHGAMPISGADYSVYGPTLATNPNDSTTIYAGFMDSSNYYPTICSINTSTLSSTCHKFTGLRTMNFQPGLAFWNGLLYMAYEDRGGSHCLYGYKIDVSTNTATAWNPISCNQQTSTAPGLAVYNGNLYVSYRSNDSSQKFTVLVSTNGSDLGNRMQPGWAMTGPAAMLDLKQLDPSINQLFAGITRNGVVSISLGQ